MAVTAFQRYEMKYLLDQTQYCFLLDILEQHMNYDAFCEGGNKYPICSVYYDTPDDQLIRRSLAKPDYKEKLRLRSYGKASGRDAQVFLELKKKICGIVNKRRAVMTLEEAAGFLSGKPALPGKYEKEQVCRELRWFLSQYPGLRPSAFISYERIAFFGKQDPDFRLTIDSNLLTRQDHLALDEGVFGERILPPRKYLMEVKILTAAPLWLTAAMSELGIYQTSFSKYGCAYKNRVMAAVQRRSA